MINVVTVHWKSSKWIEPQLDYLDRNIDESYRVFASLNGIDDEGLWSRFHFAADVPGRHPEKLNLLAEEVARGSHPDDILIFLDGDAIPVRPLVPWMYGVLERYPLMAVRRDENLGDQQPHPSFCATTVGFWQEVRGDWDGAPWTNAVGKEVTDTGGKLMYALRDRGVGWFPLLRTNTKNPHPLWFGVYDHRLYHHGAGFQVIRAERVDWEERYRKDPSLGRSLRPTRESPNLGLLRRRASDDPGALLGLRPRHLRVLLNATTKTLRLRREHRFYVRRLRSDQGRVLEQMNQEVFAQLCRDPEFFLEFDSTELDSTEPHDP